MIAMVSVVSRARSTKLAGKMAAYDLMRHTSKTASGQQNEEVVVLEAAGQKRRYVKVVFSSSGSTQIEQKYFDGTLPLELDAFRDKSCDEKTPTFVPEVNVEHIAKTYLLTDAFKTKPPGKIKSLECYGAIYKKK
jgi:hypothetical protein